MASQVELILALSAVTGACALGLTDAGQGMLDSGAPTVLSAPFGCSLARP